ncbi:MAG TPA: T9SS type A sorting domain-containing protein, partial [Candidatus Cloacimonadota bacterium]|nr:T9SS type A sorting domain-containing protein [Candidatus Cloacimonadota bacterium]
GTTGCIQTSGTRTFNTGATYIYRSSVAQVQGNGLPTTVNNLTIDNAAGVTITANHAVTTLCSVTSGSTLNVGTYVISGGTFTLNSTATLVTANTAGITATGGGATGSVQSTTRNFNTAANYTYNGTATQVSGTGFPNLCTGTLKVNTNTGISFSLSAARTMSSGGVVYLETGIFAAGTNLTMGTGSSITRDNGTITGTIQGNNAYSVLYIGAGKTTGNELSGLGLGDITINLNSGQTLTLDRSITVDNGENLNFTQGSLTLGNFNIIMNGNYSSNNLFIYNGTGALGGGNLSNLANILVTVTSPSSIPSVVNTFDVSPGVGNTLTLPGDVTTTILTFTNGSLGFNGHSVTLADRDFAFTGTNSMSALSVTLDPTAHTYNGYTSIAHAWQTNSTFTGTLSVNFLYPSSMSSSPYMTLVNRDHMVGESIWHWVALLSSAITGSYHYITLTGITTLNGSTKGDLDWTITETDQELPVELSSFTATLSQNNFVTVQWITQSETNESGFNIFRNNVDDLSSAVMVNANQIAATNSSVEHTYYFRDQIQTNDDYYYYWLQDITHGGTITYHGPVVVNLSNNGHITPPYDVPIVTAVMNVYPNPFSQATMIDFGIAKAGNADLRIFNNRGQLVRTLVSEHKNVNNYHILWDGYDENGRICASGVYIIELKSGKNTSIYKTILLK